MPKIKINVALERNLTSPKIFNSKLIIDMNIKYKATKFLHDNIGENLRVLGFDNEFLHTTPKGKYMKEKINTLNLIKLKPIL